MKFRLALICLSLAPLPSTADAQSIQLRLGWFAPRIESALFDENFETFTLEPGDFDAFVVGVELSFPLNAYLDVAVGVETTSGTAFTMYRDFVDEDGSELFQDLMLRSTPLTAGLRVFPLGNRGRFVPYATGGASFLIYEYREEGEFIDFDTLDIFGDLFIDRGVGYGGYVGAGAELGVSDSVFVFGDYRRHWARGTHGDDFRGFGRFDLTANQLSFGVAFRF